MTSKKCHLYKNKLNSSQVLVIIQELKAVKFKKKVE